MTWFTDYRHEVEWQPEGWVVSIWKGARLIQQLPFETCSAALSFVERREGCEKFSSIQLQS